MSELVKSKNCDGKVPKNRLIKIKASRTGAYGDNPVHEAYGASGAMTKVETQRRYWTFYEAVILDIFNFL